MFTEEENCYYGIVDDIDEENYLVKVTLQPDGHQTGFIPIQTALIGLFQMPSKGTLVKVDAMQNNLNTCIVTGFLYYDQFSPVKKHPKNKLFDDSKKAKEGWTIFRHFESGAEFHFTKSGKYKLFAPDGIVVSSDENISISSDKDVTINATGNIILNVPTGKNVFLGAELASQELATKGFIDQVYATHTHIGNLGAPTGTPTNLIPAVLATHTTKTKAV